uniref:D-lactate dehydrogenase n=1 Tax=Lactiplantibacillus pentosus TaxID=1589 RepID=LDHD_LACPE|nr:RecName: Full=D-lactate dehydrogenase; Short=D-LDH; AltName: Full=D-specific 2-hydroxyacid dehydrogenase [Lactiplantibacillus pentosus]BAA14352.1 D-lactate dehydrogenase [Lactiplantibacillus plantarum]
MKIIAYAVRDDERPFFDTWMKENPDVEVKLVPELLTEDNVDLAKGFDGADVYQQKDYTAEVLNKLADEGVKNISLRNVGVDNLDVPTVKARGLNISNVPAYSPNAIAELSVTQLMQLLRQTPMFNKKLAKQDFRWAPDIAKELNTMTVGVIGTGRIGRAAIDIFKGFGAKVIGYDVYRNAELEKEGMYVDTLDELYAQADVITLHVPALKDNYHMLNADAFSKMKDGAYILNFARGTLIDSEDLIKALDSGKVAGAALVTYEYETKIFNKDLEGQTIDDKVFMNLFNRDNVLITPHTAFYTETAVHNMVHVSMNSNKQFIETGKADTQVKFD